MNYYSVAVLLSLIKLSMGQNDPDQNVQKDYYGNINTCQQFDNQGCEACVSNFYSFDNYCIWCSDDNSYDVKKGNCLSTKYAFHMAKPASLGLSDSSTQSYTVCPFSSIMPRIGSRLEYSCGIKDNKEYRQFITSITNSIVTICFLSFMFVSSICFIAYTAFYKKQHMNAFLMGFCCPLCHWLPRCNL